MYEFGRDDVVKASRPDVPTHWAAMEARFTTAVREVGAPAPAVRGLVQIDGRDAIVGVRPEHLEIGTEGLPGEVTVVEELGSESFVHVTAEHQGEPLVLVVRAEGETSIDRGDNVRVAIGGPVHLFAADGGRLGD